MKMLWVDDDAPLRDALKRAVGEAFVDLRWLQADTLAEAQSCLQREPDIRFAVVDLGVATGIEGVRRLRDAAPGTTLIALSAGDQRGTVMGAIAAGAAGFVVKTEQIDALLSEVRIALDGGIPLPTSILERRTPDRPGYGTWRPTPRLPEALGYSAGEAEVLRLLIVGQPEALIARTLGLDEPTLKTHLAAVLRKLDASSRSQAVLAAARLGLRFGPLQAEGASSMASP